MTPAGAVPIESVVDGTQVFAADDTGQVQRAQVSSVADQIIVGKAMLLELRVRFADGSAETINTTDEHPFHDAQTGEWMRADSLQPGDLLSTLIGNAEVVSILFDQQRVPVYNLSIPGSPTYYIGEHGVWVHNCSPSESRIWINLKPHKGKIKTNGLRGNKRKYFEWDYTHNDIEVYNKRGIHLGSMHPNTGEIIKPPVKGRTIKP